MCAVDLHGNGTLATAIRLLAAEAHPGCLLDCQGGFLFVNQAWDHFAAENGGAPGRLGSALIGTAWSDHLIGEEIRRYHAKLIDRALRSDGTRALQVVQVSEANSPTQARLVATRFEPLMVRGGGERIGIAVVHATVRVRPIEEVYPLVAGEERQYQDEEGRVIQCSCCRRTREPASGRWDFVPSLVEMSPQGAHWAFCELCLELHYPALLAEQT
jgi:hypothetical protein